ncbi:hypothetical protein ASA1KI_32370 [Opitutales bacterium ASA1]|uniref:Gfo/Idh/MocA family protein n=1 Tax=Congregicoccus parvus TaxID=3081749 RepID=UPI002B3200BE|nr:hypothetical protein ASA1KI_32370 [Opitutales bacterium ASA1]
MSNSTRSSHPPRPRVALVGVDGYAKVYHEFVQSAHAEGRLEVAGVAVLERELDLPAVHDLRARGATVFTRYDEMLATLAGRLDLCLVPTGIQWHARMTIAALEVGANVLVEKPLAGSVADAHAIRAAESSTGRWVAVGFQDVYISEALDLKKRICAGEIGRMESVRVIGLWPRPRSYFERNHWAGRLEADGAPTNDSPVNNALAHFANLALFFAGPSPAVSASVTIDRAELLRAHRIDSFDTAVVRGHTPEGVDFWLGVTHACRTPREPEIVIRGTAGSAAWMHDRDCWVRPDRGQETRLRLQSYDYTRRVMFDSVLARLQDSSAWICGTDIAIKHTALVESIHAAAPIADVPETAVDTFSTPAGDSEFPAIHGIEESLAHAYQTGGTLAASTATTLSPSP